MLQIVWQHRVLVSDLLGKTSPNLQLCAAEGNLGNVTITISSINVDSARHRNNHRCLQCRHNRDVHRKLIIMTTSDRITMEEVRDACADTVMSWCWELG